tara:strand:- start:107 stop:280 length:174 start_codon:yes stop_codon:yes gene_type:complete
VEDEKWYSREVFGDTDDLIIEVILTHPPGTFVIIGDHPDPSIGATRARLIVPHWGEA